VELKIEMVGTMSYMMSTQLPADPTNEQVRQLKLLQRSPEDKKTEEVYKKIQDLEWSLNLHSYNGVPVIPATNIKQALATVASEEKKKPLVKRYVNIPYWVKGMCFPLEHGGPKDLEKLAADPAFRDTRLANHGKTQGKICMVLQTRPIFHTWSCTAFLDIENGKVDKEDIERWINKLGLHYGLGAYRDLYGRFTATVTDIAADAQKKAA